MFHDRIVRTVLAITAGYVIVLAVWLGWLIQYTEEGTAPYQVGGLLAAYGATLGLGMMWANRPTHADRKLLKRGMEGWATVESAQRLAETPDHGQLTALKLRLVVPGEESYTGRVVYEVAEEDRERFAPGATVTIRVDPKNRDRIILCP
ncbi:hypothetical protein [Rhodococcus tukisamuensis]|uniref:Uncharacterized protein n=1 Tax=Rhodococcus tukisamuensis TaxID=168276 RepID=A0A1G6VLM9_9NOCA|nr:hypothetical protein [Rhodococcus tukisamuensis]SDD54313.1 hypothetical protein SAMN05444580_10549 [Rhodococcus tukisamuensis]